MIITDHFVLLNFPKTGSSFMRAAVKEAYRRRYGGRWREILYRLRLRKRPLFLERMLANAADPLYVRLKGPHGVWRQIPAAYGHLPVVSATRNPLDRYVSRYLFGWWKTHPLERVPLIIERYPHYPDLTFPEYLEMLHLFGVKRRLDGIDTSMELGHHTVQFIQFYFRDPEAVFRRIDDRYIQERRYLEDMVEVRFLRQENLNEDLYRFLLEMGFQPGHLDFLRSGVRVNKTDVRDERHAVENMYTPDMVRSVLERDRLVFELFPAYKQAALRLMNGFGVFLQMGGALELLVI